MAEKKGWTDSVGVLLGGSLVVVLVLGSAVAWWANRVGANVERAHLLPDGRAIVVLRPVSVFGADHRARLAEVDVQTGVARTVVDDAGRWGYDLQVHGPAAGHYWFVSGPTTLWSRSLADIATRTDHDLSDHVELGGGFEPRWNTPYSFVVQGRAGGEYAIASDGGISPSDWTANAAAWMQWAADGRTDLVTRSSVRIGGGEVDRDALPVESGGFVVRNNGSVVYVDETRAAIVIGGDLTVPVGYPRVDRIGAIGANGLVWSVSAAELFGEPLRWDLWMERLSVRTLAIEVGDAGLMLVLRARDDEGSSELRFVTLDGATGAVRNVVPLAALD